MYRKERILQKLTRMFPEERHRVRVDRLAGGDRTVEIWTTAPVWKVKGSFVEKYLFVHEMEGKQ